MRLIERDIGLFTGERRKEFDNPQPDSESVSGSEDAELLPPVFALYSFDKSLRQTLNNGCGWH